MAIETVERPIAPVFQLDSLPCTEEYDCRSCGHSFPGPLATPEHPVSCPRCGSDELMRNPWLLGSPFADGLTEQDYRRVNLSI